MLTTSACLWDYWLNSMDAGSLSVDLSMLNIIPMTETSSIDRFILRQVITQQIEKYLVLRQTSVPHK